MPQMDSDIVNKLAEIANRTPKKRNLVIFMGRVGGAFIDNVKYAFLDCVRHFPELNAFFLTHEPKQRELLARKNLPTLLFPEPEAIQLCARAGIVVSDDFWWRSHSPVGALLQKARTLQLWHGIPLKCIGFPEIESSVNMTPEKAEYLRSNYSGYDAVLSTSPHFTEQAFARAFQANDFPELGYPRNDALLRPPDALDMLNVDAELYGEIRQRRQQGWRVVFYMPTFRDTGGDPFSDGALTAAGLSAFTSKQKVLLVCKFHPYVKTFGGMGVEHMRICPSGSDPYPLLRLADALVTDYSSIYFDYLLLDRPIIYFQYDHEDYVSKNRELMLDMEAVTPGSRVSQEADLYAALADVLQGEDVYTEKRRQLRDKSFTHYDADAGKRVNKYVLQNFVTGSAAQPTPESKARRAMA